ncbi:unnamed protein product [Urochloa decumbens]|uniref:Uncharacterized protein n=1 Tax=Urochloa decumbens TaxID=240449 RepID=A0ABC8VDM6_9POAL
MAGVAGLLTSAIVKMVGDKLGSTIGQQANLVWNFSCELQYMKETLESMEAVLKDAERRSIWEDSVRLWLKRLKNAALDISDMLDEFQTNTKPTNGKTVGIFSCLNIPTKISMANKMRKIRDQLRNIKEDHLNFRFESCHRIGIEHQFTDRETTSKVSEAGILGRDRERKRVIELLSASNDKEGLPVLPIFGLGGIGKTTLAQLVFNHIHFKDYDHRVWVYVSQVFDLKKIGNTIISQVQKEGRHNGDSMEFIYQRLQELLDDKKTLIILDDLWETDDTKLNELKLMLNVSRKMKVLITTRNEEIANRICTIPPCRLSPLNNAMCWDIIKKTTNFVSREDKQQLERIGLVIASKCGGVPLAAQALGFMLSRMNLRQWEEVSNSDIWNEPFAENSVLPSLKLTYIAMMPYLRLCFAYCAIFPRGHIIAKDNLIHQWIALDFIKPSILFSDILQLGHKYVGQLLGMSFLQHSKLPTTSQKGSLLTMHDLVYDLARSVMDEELIVCDTDKVRGIMDRKYCRYALLTNCSKPLKISTILAAKLRALLFHDCRYLGIHGVSFSFAKCLRVLELTESAITDFPESIGKLKQLRFLVAPGMKNQSLPDSVTGLTKLQYLNLSGCSEIEELPKSLGNLKNMMHLELSGCSRLKTVSEDLCDLIKLQYLNLSCCSKFERLPQGLGNITGLSYLNISSCSKLKRLPQNFGSITKLHYLNLSSCSSLEMLPEDLGNLTELQYLYLAGCHKINVLPESVGKLTNLVHLDLSQCCFRMPEALSGLAKLKYLNLSGSLNQMPFWDKYTTFTNLEHLDLSRNCFPCLPESIGNLKRLHTLDLSRCKHLRSLTMSIGSIDSLEVLVVDDCSEDLKNYIKRSGLKCNPLCHFVVCRNNNDSVSNLHQIEGINPYELQISCLQKVNIPGEANAIELSNKENLSKLTVHWTMDADRVLKDKDVLGELVPPSGLKHLELEGYISRSFPNWLMCIYCYLPNLVSLSLQDLPRCDSLPPLGQLSNLKELYLASLRSITKINADFCGGSRAFLQLSSFTLWGMKGLEEWNTTYCGEDGTEEFMFPVLDILVIEYCPRLRLKPCPPTFRKWEILDSDEVLNSGEGWDNFSHFNSAARRTKLVVWRSSYCGSWRLLHHLPTLQELDLKFLHQMTSLPEAMQQLNSLRFLKLHNCNSISMLPEWLGDLKSLECLRILKCKTITSMPSSIQQLTKLQKLRIIGNPELKQWREEPEGIGRSSPTSRVL